MNNADKIDAGIDGTCEERFTRVRNAFEDNFQKRGEVGAAVCIYRNGVKVVDLWGGHSAEDKSAPWQRDTIVCMMSVAKSIAALAVHMLIDRGEILLERPMAHYWPEFSQSGKSAITVDEVLSGRAGLLYADAAPEGSMLKWDVMIDALSAQPAQLPAEGLGAYHSMSIGYLLGELLRRVDGRHLNDFVREEIGGPLGADYQYGVTDTDLQRVTPLIPNPGSLTLNALQDNTSRLGRAWRIIPEASMPFFNRKEFLQGRCPSGNGVGNARGVARIYATLAQGGELDGVRLVSSSAIERMREVQWDGPCGMTDRPYRYARGFFLNNPQMSMGPNPKTFGHLGAGGAIGFADPEAGLAFSYSPNFMCAGDGLGDRVPKLIDAMYRSLRE